MVLDKANKASGDIINNVQAAKNLLPETKKYMDVIAASLNMYNGFPVEVGEAYIEPIEKFLNSLPQEELKKQANGLKDTVTEIKD
ncbi:hypothetical protein [Bacillus sp. SBS7]|uniref:hypothetical protein n=1 Tax=Bacillus sp. SBS7 TaxID=3401756 RepID=UPI003AA7CB29